MSNRLIPKNYNYSDLFDEAVETYRDKTFLQSVKQYCVEQNSCFLRYARDNQYQMFQEDFPGDFDIFKTKMVSLYDDKFSKKGTNVRKYYDEIKLLSPHNRCPYCLKREVRSLDHFLPKSEYPSLSITDSNLIPSCSDCNKDKLNSTDVYINYYFEDIDDVSYMVCNVNFSKEINFHYELVKPSSWSQTKFDRLKNQFEKTNLLKFYGEQAKLEYIRREKQFSRALEGTQSYSERLEAEIKDLISDEENSLGINSLEPTLWRGLHEVGEELFKYLSRLQAGEK